MISRFLGRYSISQILVIFSAAVAAAMLLSLGTAQWSNHRDALTRTELLTAIKALALAEHAARVLAATGVDLEAAASEDSAGAAPAVAASLDALLTEPGHFAEYYGEIGARHGLVAAVIASSGRVLASMPGFAEAVATDGAGGTLFEGRSRVPGVFHGPLGAGGEPYIYALRNVPGHALSVVAAVEREAALAGWRRQAVGVALTGCAGAALLWLMASRLVRQVRRREATESALRQAHHQYGLLIQNIPSALIGVGADGRITDWNRAAEQTFGIDAGAAVGRAFARSGIQWDDPESVVQRIDEAVAQGGSAAINDTRFTRCGGTAGIMDASVTALHDENGRRVGYVVLGTDTTDRRLLEAQLAQAQRLESIGQLAAGIAHEINTPTQYIGDNIRFLQDGFGDLERYLDAVAALLAEAREGTVAPARLDEIQRLHDEIDLGFLRQEFPDAVQQSLDGVGRVTKIVRAMKEFSHPGSEELVPTDINACVESTINVARNEWKYSCDLKTDLDSDLPPVPCLPGDLNQVILNMILNAVHAIEDRDPPGGRGTIRIATRWRGDWAELRISDDGNGIPAAAQARIFDPFFTTKPVGRGTGQGLAIAHNVVVHKHGGTITFETEHGKGTTFVIRLPMQAPERAADRPAVGPASA